MSIRAGTPKIVPVMVAGAIVALIAIVGLSQCSTKPAPADIAPERQSGAAGRAEGDTPAEVLARVSGQQTSTQQTMTEMQKQLGEMSKRLNQVEVTPPPRDASGAVSPTSRGRRVDIGTPSDQMADAELEHLLRKNAELEAENAKLRKGDAAPTLGGDIAPGFGYDDSAPVPGRPTMGSIPGLITGTLGRGGRAIGQTVSGAVQGDWVTVRPLDVAATPAADAAASVAQKLTPEPLQARRLSSSDQRRDENDPEQAIKPVYTIPANSTLINSISMTALIGRVPNSGSVSDPYPFKVITGPENLATNGIEIPGLQGMVWQGTAVGDWGLSCVRGELDTVTFTFDDGTIQSVDLRTAQREAGNTRSNSASDQVNGSLAWISDERGVCVAGERITNAAPILAARFGISVFDAAAQALAQRETTTTYSAITGAGQNLVTGDVARYAGFSGLSGGSDDLKSWLDQRLNQIFDAVYAPPGQNLTLHVNVEIPIDYDPIGRKVNHENFAGVDADSLD